MASLKFVRALKLTTWWEWFSFFNNVFVRNLRFLVLLSLGELIENPSLHHLIHFHVQLKILSLHRLFVLDVCCLQVNHEPTNKETWKYQKLQPVIHE
jgi:hypothetical protein